MTYLAEATRVLSIEIEGLEHLRSSLGDSFTAATQILLDLSGRVIVTGMGKSGHIACKIAATLASTGTPAQFIHPAEASHGDLGMVTPQDVIVALSVSGETKELTDIIYHAKRFCIPLIAMTQCKDSTLAHAATVCLVLPTVQEACPLQLAPTTSSLMMLALGDALAMTLLKTKKFSPADFKLLHPGGKLGKELCLVKDLMRGSIPLVDSEASMDRAVLKMTHGRLGCVGIINDQNQLIGIITDGDLRRHMHLDILRDPVKNVMTLNPKTISPDAFAVEGIRQMNDMHITNLFVVDESGTPIGILNMHDCL